MKIEHEGEFPSYVIEYTDGSEIVVVAYNRLEAEKMGFDIYSEKVIKNCYILTIENNGR